MARGAAAAWLVVGRDMANWTGERPLIEGQIVADVTTPFPRYDGDFSLRCTQNIHLSALVFGAQENVSNPNPAKVNVESWQWMVELDPNRQQASLARACQTWLIEEAR